MKKIIIFSVFSFVIGFTISFLIFRKAESKQSNDPMKSKVLFSTTQTEGYYFPTHDNLLIMDRSNAEVAEAFIVQIAPNKHSHRHIHNDTEQVFYVLSGKGHFDIERNGGKETFHLKPTDFVHVPRNCYHQTFCEGTDSLKYLAVDCFPLGKNPAEPTWESHVKVMCKMNGWNFDDTRIKKSK